MPSDDERTSAPTLADRWRRAFQTMVGAVLRELGACQEPDEAGSLAKPGDDQIGPARAPAGPKPCENGSNPRSGECARVRKCE